MTHASGVVIRRSSNHGSPDGRRPLRLEIRRRRARVRASGLEKYVTEVMFGASDAVLVPHRGGRVPGDRVSVVEAG